MKIIAPLLVLAVLAGSVGSVTSADQNHDPSIAVSKLDVDSDLALSLFASEPMLSNPAAIDVDERGRVWVCEAINYRAFRNADVIGDYTQGDRILVLEDTDGDGKADKSTTFYQGHDIDSPHGVMVMPAADDKGVRAIVSALDSVFFLIDDDGDLKADRKEVLFTGIGGVQHDHGIHSFHFGPDGKLYFNFGNEGKQIKDKDGKPIVDKMGHEVNGSRQPYQDGMVFRCNPDGSEFETLAWNFRNNWELCVDSFGTMWQSDNDDDGNRSCRLNYVMEYGNFGYKDELSGAAWTEFRTNIEAETPRRHWHQNDPGVIPNVLITGAGAPTGICVYEGSLLPKRFQGAIVLADAGPNSCRAYVPRPQGAGYTVESLKLIDGSRDKWFRPSDVCVAPDGSLMVADWCDPGVGGHRMEDIQRGRIFRLTAKGSAEQRYQAPPADVSSPRAAAALLESPNMAARCLAWSALHRMGSRAAPALYQLCQSDNPLFQARAIWALGKLGMTFQETCDVVRRACHDPLADIRLVGIRLARQLGGPIPFWTVTDAADDPSPAVRRDLLIAMHDVERAGPPAEQEATSLTSAWVKMAGQFTGEDRWYLEAIGIAAEGRWDSLMPLLMRQAGAKWKSGRAARDILWRSRGAGACKEIAAVIADANTPAEELPRFFRALDFQPVQALQLVLPSLAFDDHRGLSADRVITIQTEALRRLQPFDASQDERALAVLDKVLDKCQGSEQFIQLVVKFGVASRYADLLAIVQAKPESQGAVDALTALYDNNASDLIAKALRCDDAELVEKTLTAIMTAGDPRGDGLAFELLTDASLPLSVRRLAVKAAGATISGAQRLLDAAQRQSYAAELRDVLAATLSSARSPAVREAAAAIFPSPPGKDNKPLPSIDKLLEMKGDPAHGKTVFGSVATCSKCHQPNDLGKDIGPNLSEIGSKLSRQAMFESILYPSAAISHNFENYVIFTNDGLSHSGILVSQSDVDVKLKDENGIVHAIPANSIDEQRKTEVSLMPSNIQQLISTQELVDVVDYLSTLKGQLK